WDVALRLAHKAVELEPHNYSYQNTLGVTHYRLGQYDEAARRLEANLPRNRDHAAFDLYFLAMSYHHLGQPVRARAFFATANASVKSSAARGKQQQEELASFRMEAERVLGIVQER